jgi:hypothetical protein
MNRTAQIPTILTYEEVEAFLKAEESKNEIKFLKTKVKVSFSNGIRSRGKKEDGTISLFLKRTDSRGKFELAICTKFGRPVASKRNLLMCLDTIYSLWSIRTNILKAFQWRSYCVQIERLRLFQNF